MELKLVKLYGLNHVTKRGEVSLSGYVESLPAKDKPGPGRPGRNRNLSRFIFGLEPDAVS